MTESCDTSGPPEPIPPATDADRFAAALRGFGPVGILALIVIFLGNLIIVPLSAILVLVWARVSGTPWGEIGYVPPRSWPGSILIGVIFGVVFKFAVKAIVMPLFGAPPINQAYHFLTGNTAALPGMIYLLVAGAGFGEETLFRGYLFERFGRLLGHGAGPKIVTVMITSVWFALAHYANQGLPGVEQALITGLTFGTIFAITGSLFMLMIAHAAFDLTALAMIYWNVETVVAHLVFK